MRGSRDLAGILFTTGCIKKYARSCGYAPIIHIAKKQKSLRLTPKRMVDTSPVVNIQIGYES